MTVGVLGHADFPLPDRVRQYVRGLPRHESRLITTRGNGPPRIARRTARAVGIGVTLLTDETLLLESCDIVMAFWTHEEPALVSFALAAGVPLEVRMPTHNWSDAP